MAIYLANGWRDYELLDAGGGEKLERWGDFVLRRPDPQAIWPAALDERAWSDVSGHYRRSASGGGAWEFKRSMPERWVIGYKRMKFYVKPTGFKHTGLFPEQAANWDWMIEKIRSAGRPVKVLNLFAYTGAASVACALAGAEVVHVDAAKGMVQWAKENLHLSGLQDRPVRFLTDDVFKFVRREIRRGNRYDAIIMDPPAYGRGPDGEMWKLETSLYPFIEMCLSVLSDRPLFFLINAYTSGLSTITLANLLEWTMRRKYGGTITVGEIGLPISASGLTLPCGFLGRWEETP